MEPLSFDLQRLECPVTIDGEEYILVELNGRERDKYLNNLGGRLRHTPGGKQGVKNFDGLQASLIAASLLKIEDGERVAVKVETIQGWPARVVSALFDKAKEISALGGDEDEDDEDEEGND